MDHLSSHLDGARKVAATRKAFSTVKARQEENLSRIPDLETKRERLRKEREKCVGEKGLLEKAITNLENNGISVHLAGSAEDAISHILRELGDEKIVVKAKSNTTREVCLNDELGASGIEVIETDIGDRIMQIAGESPSHPTGPISHLTKDDILQHLSSHFGVEGDLSDKEMVDLIKGDIIAHIKKANIGITGANAIAAEEGAIAIIHNEGNVLEVMRRPGKHIIIAGTDKIYSNLEEVMNMGKLQTYFATGSIIPSYINILGGPSKTADIEKRLIKGVHGPGEISLVLLDNRRSEVFKQGFGELLYCIGCGSCLLHCPIYSYKGKKFSGGGRLGGKGVVHSTLLDSSTSDELNSCVTCGRCKDNCPVDLDVPSLVKKLRKEHPGGNAFITSHLRLLEAAVRYEVLMVLSKTMGTPHD